ncbi:tryptophan halogenase family protein [Shewanella sp. Isolate11]|uniref:tryptophan halogenase family protein n=1 Tax=Shewanella sp. Isolate11 TaxID=2908530 RepID=UPI001EFD50FB|nr:tryptophan halogenase family protein [Shewanella sp. Isolate11]MCG9696002.1 tryptophan 7-halogenase [Shewanella sp. Isolate11]
MKAANKAVTNIIVVGGGTAGWITACHLAKKWVTSEGQYQVTLVESPNIPTIGVGEGTVPMMRETLKYFGIREDEFIRHCDVTFKQSVKFIDWNTPNSGDYYHHLFDYPAFKGISDSWLKQACETRRPFSDLVSVQGQLADAGFGPRSMANPQFIGQMNYAYHLDAAKFTQMLTRFGIDKLGVKHQLAEVVDVITDDEGKILNLITDQAEICGDLYVDCTGFSARLIGQACQVPFVDKSNVLFVDTALVAQVPYAQTNTPIPCFTQSTAKEAGWIWDIGLTQRRGVGYVYSSRYSSDEQAETVLREYLGSSAEGIRFRKVPMKVGYRAQSWHRNCVAIGLSSGFVEPLEATGLLIFDVTARMLAESLPANEAIMDTVAKRYNQRVQHAWNKVIDFIKLHYVVAKRDDSEFWRDNRKPETIPESLQQSLALWQYHQPSAYDFASTLEVFNLENYLYVLYGSDFETESCTSLSADDELLLQQRQSLIDKQIAMLKPQLLPHRQLLQRIAQYGIQLN